MRRTGGQAVKFHTCAALKTTEENDGTQPNPRDGFPGKKWQQRVDPRRCQSGL